jgi:hypothetical protein
VKRSTIYLLFDLVGVFWFVHRSSPMVALPWFLTSRRVAAAAAAAADSP